VFSFLPEDRQRFLLQTSILDRLCGSLCAAVTGEPASQETLEALERDSLFLLPLDDNRQWYRYQPLFAGFLAAELQSRHPGEIAALHRRAADWLLAHELPELAFQHVIAGEYVQCAVEIFDRYITIKLPAGEFDLVEQWLNALPQAWLEEFPGLDIARAGLLAYAGAVRECRACLDGVEEKLAGRDDREADWQRARVTAVRCFVACMQNDLAQAEALAAQALRDLPESDANYRPGIYGALGDTYRRNARWEEARDAYVRVLEAARSPTVRFYTAHVSGALADLALERGQLKAAADYWRKALAAVEAQADNPVSAATRHRLVLHPHGRDPLRVERAGAGARPAGTGTGAGGTGR
jgi:LuxR family transcriptional regulator, maltose regulon positive regulatory protein